MYGCAVVPFSLMGNAMQFLLFVKSIVSELRGEGESVDTKASWII
jgi:hypothetical protein